MPNAANKRCGYIAIVGRPNVGKSTLLNCIIGQKVCITSRKAQTTRHRILAVKTEQNTQCIFLDTPGLSQRMSGALNKTLKKTALHALREVDVVLWCVSAAEQHDDDLWVLDQCRQLSVPVFAVINQIDRLSSRDAVLPYIDYVKSLAKFQEIVPISAKKGDGVAALHALLGPLLPTVPHFFFPEDQVSDRSDRFTISELVREQCLYRFGQEVPHQVAVQVEHMAVTNHVLHIQVLIWVARPGQKTILLGQKGAHLKLIGERVRKVCETVFAQKVCLKTWVKVKKDWSERQQDIRFLGYDES